MVDGDYVIVDDDLFNYIAEFTKDSGKRHFLYTIAMVESGMDPYSKRGECGEFGMMQVMPATGSFLSNLRGEKLHLDKVRGNIFSALDYLHFIIDKIDQHCPANMPLDDMVQIAAAAYNGGAGHISKGCEITSFNSAAQGYSRRFLLWWKMQYMSRSTYEHYLGQLSTSY